jgi:hypothetical protein
MMLQRKNATANDATTKECHNEEFVSIKSGGYNKHRCYIERGGILSADLHFLTVDSAPLAEHNANTGGRHRTSDSANSLAISPPVLT